MNDAGLQDLPETVRCGSRWLACAVLLAMLVVTAAGCDALDDAANPKPIHPQGQPGAGTTNGKDVVEVAPPAPAEKLIELVVAGEGTLRFGGCYVKLIPATSGRRAVLQITSYPDPSAESFPSVFIRAAVDQDEIKKLLGQPLPARIFMTRSQDSTVWHTPDAAPANIVIQNVDDSGRVVGTIIDAVVLNSDSPDELTISGRFDGSLQ